MTERCVFNPCVIIPIYDNEDTIRDVVESLAGLDLPCVIVDDGSNAATQRVLAQHILRFGEIDPALFAFGGPGGEVRLLHPERLGRLEPLFGQIREFHDCALARVAG